MICSKAFAALGLSALIVLAAPVLAAAEEAAPAGGGAAAAPPVANAPLSPEEVSLHGFGLQNAQCLEWTDNCSICLRDEKDAVHCSTPGIACQPVAIACRREKAK
jgi:hypothetical protein